MTTVLHPVVAGEALPGLAAYGAARLLAGTGGQHRLDLQAHRQTHGRSRYLDHTGLASAAAEVLLLGRGGAGFPVAAKLRATPAAASTEVLVNGSEGEPASYKDRALMRLSPHLVLDGAVGVARALGTRRVTIVVHDQASGVSFEHALRERDDAGSVRLVGARGGFVGGEVRAVMSSLSGGPAAAPGRRVLPTVTGVDGRPTFASNVETYAQLALLMSLGTREYGAVGSATEPGTTLLTMWGDLTVTGVVEVPTGLPLGALVGDGEDRPMLVGGYHGTWITSHGSLTLDRPGMAAAGAPLNAGVIARLPRDACALGEVASVARWLAGESAGQCGPCLFGLPELSRVIDALARGVDLTADARRRAGLLVGRGACAHPDGSASFVRSALDALTDEVLAHQGTGGCGRPVRGVLPVPPRSRA